MKPINKKGYVEAIALVAAFLVFFILFIIFIFLLNGKSTDIKRQDVKSSVILTGQNSIYDVAALPYKATNVYVIFNRFELVSPELSTYLQNSLNKTLGAGVCYRLTDAKNIDYVYVLESRSADTCLATSIVSFVLPEKKMTFKSGEPYLMNGVAFG